MTRYVQVRSLVTIVSLLSGCRSAGVPHACPIPDEVLPPPRTIGTEHPILAVATSPTRRWAVYCQARTDTNGDGKIEVGPSRHAGFIGDELKLYLTYRDGIDVEIEAYRGRDRSGRHLLVVHKGRLVLIDAMSGAWTRIGAAGAADPDAVSVFSPDGRKLLYMPGGPTGPQTLAVRDLCDGTERFIEPGREPVLDARFDATSQRVVLAVRDPTQQGVLDPFFARSLEDWPRSDPCRTRGEWTSWGAPHGAVLLVAPIFGGRATPVIEIPEAAPEPGEGARLVPEWTLGVRGYGTMPRGPLHWDPW